MTTARLCFPPDHPVEALRGFPMPGLIRMKRALAKRCAWLDTKIGERTRRGEPVGLYLEELAAIVVLVERIEEVDVTNASPMPNSWTEDGEPIELCETAGARAPP